MMKTILLVALVASCFAFAAAESSLDKLKAKVEAGTAAAPCDKAVPSGPAPPKQYLDQRLPIVVGDYHPPAGGFNPTDIPSAEVDAAARKILREVQKAEAQAAAEGGGGAPAAATEMTTEEHKAMKQLLLDADILVRAAGKMLAENGPIEEKKQKKVIKKVIKSAIKKAAKNLKKKNKKGKKSKKLKKAKKQRKGTTPAAKVGPATAPQKKSKRKGKGKHKKGKKKGKKAAPATPAAPAAAKTA